MSAKSGNQVRSRPGLETLGDRIVPALDFVMARDLVGESLTIRTTGNDDNILIRDTGGTSGRNLTVTGTDMNTGVDWRVPIPAGRFIRSITVRNAGAGLDNVTYELADSAGNPVALQNLPNRPATLDRVLDVDLGDGNDTFFANVPEVGTAAGIFFFAQGRNGSDTLEVEIDDRLRQNSQLTAVLSGGLGWDAVSVDAWSTVTMDPGSVLTVDVAGNERTDASLNDTADAGNNVSFWYLGPMNGTLVYNVRGGGGQGHNGRDWVSANLWFNAGSTGVLGSGANGAAVHGGAGDDDVNHIIRGGRLPQYNNPVVSGGAGSDRLHRSADPNHPLTVLDEAAFAMEGGIFTL